MAKKVLYELFVGVLVVGLSLAIGYSAGSGNAKTQSETIEHQRAYIVELLEEVVNLEQQVYDLEQQLD